MSVTVEKREDGPGDAAHVEAAWQLKERIRREEGVLKQRKGFFTNAYRRARCHLFFVEDPGEDRLVGFVSARRDGYVLFLAVAPEFRGEGYGRRLVAAVARNHESITCHARTTNDDAVRFYERVGFEVERRIDNYYEDGGDAYYLKLGEERSLADKLSDLVGR